jgi:hypothetical protein
MIRLVLIGLHAALGVAAIAAGQAFVRDPTGRALGMSAEYLKGSPFPDFRVPGFFLAVVIGTANLVSAVALGRRHALSAHLSLATGVLLVTWVAIQTAIIGFRHWSQGIWWGTFMLVTVLAALVDGRLARIRRARVRLPGASCAATCPVDDWRGSTN